MASLALLVTLILTAVLAVASARLFLTGIFQLMERAAATGPSAAKSNEVGAAQS